MAQRNKKDLKEPTETEQQWNNEPTNREYEKRMVDLSPDWELLSRAAETALQGADLNLSHKEYRFCDEWIKLWLDIRQYAYDQLSREDYRYFCCSQFSVAVAGIQ